MIYILILIIRLYPNDARIASLSVEFNTRQACEAAAAEAVRQAGGKNYTPIIFCAAKGSP